MSRTLKPKFLHGRKFSWHLGIQSITVGTRGDWNSSWFLQLKLRNFFHLQCSTFLPESVWICRSSWCSLRQPTTRKTVSRVCCCVLEKKLPGYYYWTMEWILEHHHALLLLLLIIIFLQIGSLLACSEALCCHTLDLSHSWSSCCWLLQGHSFLPFVLGGRVVMPFSLCFDNRIRWIPDRVWHFMMRSIVYYS